MLNSGAIMTSAISLSLLHPEMRLAEKFDYLLEYVKVILLRLNFYLNRSFVGFTRNPCCYVFRDKKVHLGHLENRWRRVRGFQQFSLFV